MRSNLDVLHDQQLGTTLALVRFARSLLRHGVIPESVRKDIQNDIRDGVQQIKTEYADDHERLRDILWTYRALIHRLEPKSPKYSEEEVMKGALDQKT